MKTLTLLRHAKSSWDNPDLDDFDRPLNERGRHAARAVGQAMRERGIAFDRVVASPAVRVVETLEDVFAGYGDRIRPHFDHRIYLASTRAMLEVVQEADDSADRLLLVGHNPGIGALAELLTCEDGNGLRQEMAEKYPTGAVAEIELDVSHWRDVGAGRGRLARFLRPRDLDGDGR